MPTAALGYAIEGEPDLSQVLSGRTMDEKNNTTRTYPNIPADDKKHSVLSIWLDVMIQIFSFKCLRYAFSPKNSGLVSTEIDY